MTACAWGTEFRIGIVVGLALYGLAGSSVQAQVATDIRTDGRLGAATTLPGPNVEIRASLGRQAGKNLYHSFERFSLGTNDIATFTGPPGLDNVISRVTGGVRSTIDGTLRSTVPGADFWFINPSGISFGPNANLDVPASFHVSTADELRFPDGLTFSARSPADAVLSSAPPEAFGFLSAKPASIEVEVGAGRALGLLKTEGEILSIFGGDIAVSGGQNSSLSSAGGEIRFVSLASPGVAPVDGKALISASALGTVDVRGPPSVSGLASFNVTTNGSGGGTIQIRSGQLIARDVGFGVLNLGTVDATGGIVIDASTIDFGGATYVLSSSLTDKLPGKVEIKAKSFRMEGTGGIGAFGVLGAAGGDVSIEADTIAITAISGPIGIEAGTITDRDGGRIIVTARDSFLLSGAGAAISSSTQLGSGNAGSIAIYAQDLKIRDGADIRATTSSEGKGGAVIVTGNVIQLENGGSITSTTEGSGAGGLILVAANEEIRMSKGSAISGETFGTGDAGQVGVGAPRIFVDNSFIGANTRGTMESAGKGGPVVIIAGKVKLSDEGPEVVADGYLEFTNEGRVFTGTEGPGAAGNIRVDAGTLVADKQPIDHEHINHTGISASSQAGSSGNGGSVTVNAHAITLRNGAQITSDTKGTGNAGDVSINTRTLHLENGGLIATCSGAGPDCNQRGGGPDQTGDAGNITVQASDQIIIEDARITTFAVSAEASGGTITLNTGNLIDLHGGEISSEVLGNQGTTAGNIVINSPFLILNDSRIIARATEGKGGDIDIVADNLLRSSESIIDASAETGIDGTVVVSSPEADVTSGLVVLPAEFVDAGSRLKESCAIRGATEASRFDRAGRALPPGPGDPQVATYAPDSDERAEGDKGASEHLAFAGWGVGEARIVCGAAIE